MSYVLEADDADLPANVLTYTAEGLPDGLSISPSTGAITGVLSETAVGEHDVVVTVADDATPKAQASTAFAWTVTATEEDLIEPPTIDPVAEQYSEEEETVSLQVVASGSGPLLYETAGLPPGLDINAAAGLISGTTAADTAGSHHVTITVTDSQEARSSGEISFYWIVTDVAAAEQKGDLVVALDGFSEPDPDSRCRRSRKHDGSAVLSSSWAGSPGRQRRRSACRLRFWPS